LGLKNETKDSAVSTVIWFCNARQDPHLLHGLLSFHFLDFRYQALLGNKAISAAVLDAGKGSFRVIESCYAAVWEGASLKHCVSAENAKIFALSNAYGAAFCLACELHDFLEFARQSVAR
jgi:hypothetical protein